MHNYYSEEKNVQILIAILKANGINKIIASPGTTNISFVRSLQNDSFFEIYSSVDERSASYIACGLATETGEPVVLSCTGATASRNYLPGLTEAYYRKLPVLAVTSTQISSRVGQHIAQVIDRSSPPKDAVKYSTYLNVVKDSDDWDNCVLKANEAVLELYRKGGGPVHINLETTYGQTFDVKELPFVRVIKRIDCESKWPAITKNRVALFVGSHLTMNKSLVKKIDEFCASNNSVVFVDHTSGYRGKYAVQHSLLSSQRFAKYHELKPDLTIHIGEITGDYSANAVIGNEVWRVSEDGQIRDTFKQLSLVFEVSEASFFEYYTHDNILDDSYLNQCKKALSTLQMQIPDLPFSNLWIANELHDKIPQNSTIHFGILNSLRSWNFFEISKNIDSTSNVGGFGIDGNLSSLIGASLANPNKLFFGILGDLAFFYDMNSLGNRHVGNNLRILLINNGVGTEFKNFNHSAYKFGNEADYYMAARGHFGNQSKQLVKNYCENLGFKYLSASNKEEFMENYQMFLSEKSLEKSIVFEVFTNDKDESKALELITSIDVTTEGKIKNSVKNVIGQKNINRIKRVLGS